MEPTQKQYYKYCMVPLCPSTTFKTPDKLFIRVPQNKSRRLKWLKACRSNEKDISEKTTAHVCEDHFNLEEDMGNYVKFKLMGGLKKMKANVVPHIFDCQPDKKRSFTNHPRASAVEEAKRRIVDEAIASSSMTHGQIFNQVDLQMVASSTQNSTIGGEIRLETSDILPLLDIAISKRMSESQIIGDIVNEHTYSQMEGGNTDQTSQNIHTTKSIVQVRPNKPPATSAARKQLLQQQREQQQQSELINKISTETDQIAGPSEVRKKKKSTERVRQWRKKNKSQEGVGKKRPKTAAERMREYRKRKSELRAES